ncbi:hypothetical protein BLA29_002440 [Euroglyphus maynei]|uniref:Uncharacterized protein n=1 Tax=Euroglyphus maynei TaxID=6958 RepID=A0A1Y3AZI3_EURMA|nr:hypothetical protein BLA29_002440 [Euroglyphus maynei]
MSSSINIRFIGIIAILSAIILMLQITSTMTQITFSKDWRAGGKRSFGSNNGYSNNADNLMEIFTRNNHCDQITNNLIIIQELIRKEANELLRCQRFGKSNTNRIKPELNDNNESQSSTDH